MNAAAMARRVNDALNTSVRERERERCRKGKENLSQIVIGPR